MTDTPANATAAPAGDASAVAARPEHPAYAAVLSGLLQRLVLLRRVAKAMLIGETAAWLAAVWVAGGIAIAMTDYLLRMPGWLRGGWLGAGAAVAAWLLWHRVIPAWRFRPNLTEFALRLERSDAGKRAGLEGVLASAVDMAVGRAYGHEPARAAFVAEAAKRSVRVGIWSVLRPGRIIAAVLAAGAMALLVVGLFTAQPTLTAIGSLRILAPWSAAEWPRRTDIETAMTQRVHPLGQTLALRAALLRSDDSASRTRIEARYRIYSAKGEAGPVRRVMLTSQERPVEVATTDPLGNPVSATGTLFERLIEPSALEPDGPGAVADPTVAEKPAEIEFWLSTDDDQTVPQRMLLVHPPQVVSASATITPPGYFGGEPAHADLGAGVDERATIPAVLRGSRVRLEIALNKPVPRPVAGREREWISGMVGEQFAALVHDARAGREGLPGTELWTELTGNRLTVNWVVRESVRLPVRPVDEYGIAADGEAVFRIEAREDRAPEATVTRPAEDIEALPTAKIEIAAEGRDDVALESVTAEWRLARRAAGSEGAAPEPTGEPAELMTVAAAPGKAERLLTATTVLDIEPTGAASGDEIWITALAKDRFELEGEKRHEPVRSTTRRVRIISKEQLLEQVWTELGSVRRSAIRMAEQQEAIRQGLQDAKDRPGASRNEASLRDSAAHQAETVQRLSERLKSNALSDPDMAAVLNESAALLERAREAAAQASSEMRRGEEAKGAGKEAEAQAAKTAAEPQAEKAQQALEQLAELLDKGEDAWSVRRGIERLIEDQKALRQQTSKLGEQTVGKAPSELSPQQQQQAAQLSEQQRALSDRAEEVMNRLQQAAEQMREQDPAGAQALQEAAQKAERAKMQQQMDQAAKDIQQNRQQSATQQQDKAVNAMEEMLEQMQQAARSRDEVLKRELASLVESLDALIKKQEGELGALDVGAASGFANLDRGMIALRQNTLAVLEMARATGAEAREAAGLIESASAAQGDAVGALRASPVDSGAANVAEQTSLDKLKQARALAEKARQNAEERTTRQQRAELKKSYRELLDAQLDLRAKTKDVSTMEEGRRKRAAARDLAPLQDQIRQKAADLAASATDIAKSETFGYAHGRLTDSVAAAAARLAEGEADRTVLSRQNAAVRVLQSILEALADQDKNSDEFREQNEGGDQGGAGGQQGGQKKPEGLIPPAAELKLLRSLQSEALAVTREAAESGDAELSVEAAALQKSLVERAKAVLEKLQQESKGGGMPDMKPADGVEPPPNKPDEGPGQGGKP